MRSGCIPFHKKDTSYQQLEGNLSSLLECGSAFWQSSSLFRAPPPWTTSCGRACPSPCIRRRPRWRSRPSRCPMAWTASPSPFPSHQVWSPLSPCWLHSTTIACKLYLPSAMSRIYIYPYCSDMLWRYPNPFLAQPPPSPLETQVKSGLPGELN